MRSGGEGLGDPSDAFWLAVYREGEPHLNPILQSMIEGASKPASRSSIWMYISPSCSTRPW